jgi:hypothetical protein
MKNGGIRRVFVGALVLAAAVGLGAADHYKVLNGPKDFYFGHISFVEEAPEGSGPTVRREGSALPEPGVLNLPIGPGDTIRTSSDRRCEIQFDTGTIVRLDFATEVRVETILARSLSSLEELSVLSLAKGRIYVMYKEYGRKEMFQVLTANAAVKMKHNSVSYVTAAADGTTETQVKYGSTRVLFGPDEKRLDDRAVKKGERLIVLADHQFELAAAIDDTAFELWNKDINAHFDELHDGLTPLPKPIQYLPPAVFYFAQAYGNTYGEWLWDDFYGYIWRPYIDNGRYPWGWSPYYYGFWSNSGGQMFWVPQEPWGWVPYHLGIWQWDKKRGWFWMPGSLFAPAWVDWDFYYGYASWRPWSVFDWMYRMYPVDYAHGDPYMYGSDPNWITYFRYMRGNWDYYWPMGGAPFSGGGTATDSLAPVSYRKPVSRDALKEPPTGSLPVPSELKGLVKRVADAYAKGDPAIRESAAQVPRNLVFVAKEDLTARAIHEKALTWDRVPKQGPPAAGEGGAAPRVADPRREASRVFRGIAVPAAAPRRTPAPEAATIHGGGMIAVPEASASPVARDSRAVRDNRVDRVDTSPAAGRREGTGDARERGGLAPARFRDWNPDLRVARELGVHIEYSSMRNEVRCPELKLSSQDRFRSRGLTPRMTSEGVSYGPATSVGGGSAGGSSSTASAGSGPTAGRAQSEGTSTASGGRETKGSGTSEGGKIKN